MKKSKVLSEKKQAIVGQNVSARMHYDNDGDATFGGEIGVRVNKYKMNLNKLITDRINEYALDGDSSVLDKYGFLFTMIAKEHHQEQLNIDYEEK